MDNLFRFMGVYVLVASLVSAYMNITGHPLGTAGTAFGILMLLIAVGMAIPLALDLRDFLSRRSQNTP